jgi:hypothetical protein
MYAIKGSLVVFLSDMSSVHMWFVFDKNWRLLKNDSDALRVRVLGKINLAGLTEGVGGMNISPLRSLQ